MPTIPSGTKEASMQSQWQHQKLPKLLYLFSFLQPSRPNHQKKQSTHPEYLDSHALTIQNYLHLTERNKRTRKKRIKLNAIMVPKLIKDFLKVIKSFSAKDIPIPKIGPIKGDINMAPITTAVELHSSQ